MKMLSSTLRQIILWKRVRKFKIFEVYGGVIQGIIMKEDINKVFPTMHEAEKEVFSRAEDWGVDCYVILPVYILEERVIQINIQGEVQETFPFLTKKERIEHEIRRL